MDLLIISIFNVIFYRMYIYLCIHVFVCIIGVISCLGIAQRFKVFSWQMFLVSTLEMLNHCCITTFVYANVYFPAPTLNFNNCALFFPLWLFCYFLNHEWGWIYFVYVHYPFFFLFKCLLWGKHCSQWIACSVNELFPDVICSFKKMIFFY